MKIERISDNQIKCTLSRQDLDAKNIKIAELAYGTEKARALFRELIEQASVELDFEVDESPLMIEAVPTSMDSLVLIVTRVDNPDELDSRFSRFTHLSSDDNIEEIEDFSEDEEDDDAVDDSDDSDDNDDIFGLDEQGNNEFIDMIKAAEERINAAANKAKDDDKAPEESDSDKPAEENSEDKNSINSLRDQIREGLSGLISSIAKSVEGMAANSGNGENPHIEADITIETVSHPQATPQSASEIPFDVYIFKNISDVISAAKDLSRIYFGDNTLYKDESTGRFYLYITNNANSLEDYLRTQQILIRYAAKCRTTYASISYYNEHFKVIRRKNALQLMATI
ncbi:MAG: adaptor protein MecA [Eubacterium sp.]|nr:adaptor protein MecA [Eubacterium sp.]